MAGRQLQTVVKKGRGFRTCGARPQSHSRLLRCSAWRRYHVRRLRDGHATYRTTMVGACAAALARTPRPGHRASTTSPRSRLRRAPTPRRRLTGTFSFVAFLSVSTMRRSSANHRFLLSPIWRWLRRKTCYLLPKTCDLRPRSRPRASCAVPVPVVVNPCHRDVRPLGGGLVGPR
jgi:hypothetical protein